MFTLLSLSEEGPNTELVWLLLAVLGFFFLMVIIGWLTSLNKKPEIQAEHVDHAQEEPRHDQPKHDNGMDPIGGSGQKAAKARKS